MIDVRWNPSERELRVFAALEMLFFGAIAAIVFRRTGSAALAGAIVAASVAVGVAGLAVPRFLRYVYVAWMAAVFPIGWVVSHLVLALVYFGVFTPLGLLMRLFAGDPLQRRFDRNAATYWSPRPKEPPPARYFRPF